jgi:hypothetical protein
MGAGVGEGWVVYEAYEVGGKGGKLPVFYFAGIFYIMITARKGKTLYILPPMLLGVHEWRDIFTQHASKNDTKSLLLPLRMQQISSSSKVLFLEKKKCSPSCQSCAFRNLK